ncbi:hypothetical protein K523DRAFT_415749 [Schizophyllum commune Tattone D]|nr:hypothetical protein K523DRAFT_415749 [Schizophyllum commune Tattone D]
MSLDLGPVFVALTNVQDSKYTYVASMTIMLYDMLLTLPEETNWHHTYPLSCKRAYLPPTMLGIISLTSVEFILVLRTYALYRSKALLALLSFLCIISAATMGGVNLYLRLNVIEIQNPTFPPPVQVGCIANCSLPICRHLLTAFWIPFFFIETAIFVLTFRKMQSSVVGMTNHSKLVQIFYRDGFVYYIVVMCISIANLLVWILAPNSLSYIVTSVMRSLQVTVGSRILLNIRSVRPGAHTSSYHTTTPSLQGLSDINFQVPVAVARQRAQEQNIMFSEVNSMSYDDAHGEMD